MSNLKNLSVYFFKITPKSFSPTSDLSSEKEITDAFQFPDFEKKEFTNVKQTNGEVGLYGDIMRSEGLTFGTFTFIQTEFIPPGQNKKTKKAEKLALSDDHGLGYQTSFIFDTETNIIGVVSRNPGVNISSIKRFMEINYKTPKLSSENIITKATLEDFFKVKSYKKLSLTIANPTDFSTFSKELNLSVGQIAKIANELNSGKLTINFDAPKNGTLNVGIIKNIAQSLHSIGLSNVEKFIVTGNDPNIEQKTYDFLSGRIKETIMVEKTKHNNFKTHEVYEQLLQVFYKNAVYLREFYPNKIE